MTFECPVYCELLGVHMGSSIATSRVPVSLASVGPYFYDTGNYKHKFIVKKALMQGENNGKFSHGKDQASNKWEKTPA